MSIKLTLRTAGLKDLIGSYIREHSSEIAIVGIMTTVLAGVAVLVTGISCMHSPTVVIDDPRSK